MKAFSVRILLAAASAFLLLVASKYVFRMQGGRSRYHEPDTKSTIPKETKNNTKPAVCDSAGQYCVSPLQGEWVRQPDRIFHAPICCGWDQPGWDQGRLMPRACGRHRWTGNMQGTVRSQTRHRGAANNELPVQIGGNACTCVRSSRNFTDEYVWKSPSAISFHSNKSTYFDPQRTCNLLGNRTVLILGDSTSQQFAYTIMTALQRAGCAPQLRFSLSDTLISLEWDRGYNWYDEVSTIQPDIVIWGVGPHLYSEGADEQVFTRLMKNVTAGMEAYQSEQRRRGNPVTRFVYKTQQPGGCNDKPLLRNSPDEAATEMIHRNLTAAYNYRHFHDWDIYALSYFTKRNMAVIDLRMLYSRPDAHIHSRDCLHMCLPGPMDIAADLFQNFLEEDEIQLPAFSNELN